MAILRSIPRSRKMPSLRNVVMIDTVRGVLRVRKWPKKYGKPRSALQAWWVDWFKQANRLAKYADGMAQARAIEMTKGSGLYPRDVMLSAMRGRLYIWADTTGRKWYPMAAVQDISESLDVLAQTVGSVLVRAVDRWRAPAAGAVGDVLTYQGDAAPPDWQTPIPASGVLQEELAGTPIYPDNSVNYYDFDVTGYADVAITFHAVGFAAADMSRLRLSIDDGVTYKNGAADYMTSWLNHAGSGYALANLWGFTNPAAAAGHYGTARISNLRAGRAILGVDASKSTTIFERRSGTFNYNGPVTHIRLFSNGGNNFNAGTILVVGLAAASPP